MRWQTTDCLTLRPLLRTKSTLPTISGTWMKMGRPSGMDDPLPTSARPGGSAVKTMRRQRGRTMGSMTDASARAAVLKLTSPAEPSGMVPWQ